MMDSNSCQKNPSDSGHQSTMNESSLRGSCKKKPRSQQELKLALEEWKRMKKEEKWNSTPQKHIVKNQEMISRNMESFKDKNFKEIILEKPKHEETQEKGENGEDQDEKFKKLSP
eukprot:Sdes_comp24637_c0_seq1m22462